MGFFKNRFGGSSKQHRPPPPSKGTVNVDAVLYEGSDPLEVVGESHYQDALWATVGRGRGWEVRHEVVALLVPEPDNPYDSNAVAVYAAGGRVGRLSRETGAEMKPGVEALMKREGKGVALNGVVVGGGNGRSLGLFLSYDPADFGLAPLHVRTGFSSVDLDEVTWRDELPSRPPEAVTYLRGLLAEDGPPMERHFMFQHLEELLYQSRDAFASALDEYDQTCREHDAEMDTIRPALIAEMGGLPLLEMYKRRCTNRAPSVTRRRTTSRGRCGGPLGGWRSTAMTA